MRTAEGANRWLTPNRGCIKPGTVQLIVTTTYLEQRDPDELIPARKQFEGASIVRVDAVAPEFSRFLYTAVGGDWRWTDRSPWTIARWKEWLSRQGSETWVAWVGGAPAGYVELAAEHDEGTHSEIAHFRATPRLHRARSGRATPCPWHTTGLDTPRTTQGTRSSHQGLGAHLHTGRTQRAR